ncbi:MAG TPA: SigE family RNA polymerase sigma factor [Frankiaceae bacterium]|nr:SigE family RNA polymerase sigma factor [Frankiaceae bacterium]
MTAEPALVADHAAFEEYVRGDATALLRLAVLLAGDRDAGSDLAQEALARVARAWRRRVPDDPHAFARTVLVNLARDRRRMLRRRPKQVPFDDGYAGTTDPFGNADLRASLLREVARLPARQRAVLVLRFYEDLSERETAAVLGCSVSSVKTHTQRALGRLRETVEEAG